MEWGSKTFSILMSLNAVCSLSVRAVTKTDYLHVNFNESTAVFIFAIDKQILQTKSNTNLKNKQPLPMNQT